MFKNIIIRPAGIPDAGPIGTVHSISANLAYANLHSRALLDLCFSATVLSDVARKNIVASLDAPDRVRMDVVTDANRIVGFAHAAIANDADDAGALEIFRRNDIVQSFNGADVLHFKTIYFLPEFQLHGLGTQLFLDALRSPMAMRTEIVFTETLDGYEASPKFFKKFGAVVIGQYEVFTGAHYGIDKTDGDAKVTSVVHRMNAKQVVENALLNVHKMNKMQILHD
ncbi:MAG: hypothetical protein FWC51_01890 [Proteobacteria bacterium]|nr:hypothetical protein [Pseudomonadota bacterium]